MKTIGIDARLYSQTGVGTYLRNFLHFLAKKTYTDITFLIYLLEGEKTSFENPAFKKIFVPYKWHSLTEQTGFYARLIADKPDLMHFTYFSYPVLYTRPFIATVHDLTPIQFKTGKASTRNPIWYGIKHAAFKYVLKSQVMNSKRIITPTQTVKKQLLEYFPSLSTDKVWAIYEGVDNELATIPENKDLARKYTKPYFLYVGNFYQHKNVETLIKAFKDIPEPFELILSGPNDFFADKMEALINEHNLEKRVFMHHSKGRGDVKYFYAHAEALIHPSLSEGFGLPLVEAMAADLPIIASDIPVFRELLPSDNLLFNPSSSADIAATVQKHLKQPKKPLYKAILARYSFETMTEKTLELYYSALSL